MLRTIGGVVAGYLVIALLVSGLFALAFLLLGTNNLLRQGSYQATAEWNAVSLLLGFGCAVAGGLASVAIGRGFKAASILASMILVVGLTMAVMTASRPAPAPPERGETSTLMDIMQNGREPAWVAFSNPFIGAAGVLVGGRMKRKG